jgi:Abortive infection C-terminus
MSSDEYNLTLAFQETLVNYATGGGWSTDSYEAGRRALVSHPGLRKLTPPFVKDCRTLKEFWAYISQQAATYAERRKIIRGAFAPLLSHLENSRPYPDEIVTLTLASLNVDYVHDTWRKALDRRTGDPEGAITAARTLLEAVCKTILDEEGVEYGDEDLPKLYSKTARHLELAPSQHTEEAFKTILGGCRSVVNGLGTIRNRLGDAHGKGRKAVRPAARHAALAVSLAGAMSVFLVETWQFHRTRAALPSSSRKSASR